MTRYLTLLLGTFALVSPLFLARWSAADELADDNVVYASDEGDPAPARPPVTVQPQAQTASYYSGALTPTDEALSNPIPTAPAPGLMNSNQCGCSDCTCGGCGSCDCCNNCWPRWYVQAEAIFLWRNNDSVVRPVIMASPTDSTVFNTRSADFDTGVGPRTLIGLRTSENTGWECQYFSALAMSGSADISSPDQLVAADNFAQLWGVLDAARIDYDSELHNVEVNYYRSWNTLSLLGGFRFVRLSENYGLDVIGGGSDFYDVNAENNLFGGQLGGRWRECCGQFYFDFTGKAGVFGNDANQSQYLTSGGGSSIDRNFTSYESCVAFVGDLNLSVGFRFSKVWAARCGYNVLWIDQVAMAADQLDFNVGSNAGRAISTSGDVFLHGINVGLEGRW